MSVAESSLSGMHAVQFYDDEAFLYRSLRRFFSEGLRNGDPLVMLAQPRMFEGLASYLASGVDGPPVDAHERILFWDADQVLDAIVVDGLPDPDRLRQLALPLVKQIREAAGDAMIWIGGNTSSLLCSRGNHAGAEALEHLWNELTARSAISTLCTYAMSDFDSDVETRHFQSICGRHGQVYPAEGYSDAGDDRARLEQVALLQHRVRTLDRPASSAPLPEPDRDDASAGSMLYVIDDDVSVRRGLKRLLAAVRQPAQIFESAEAFLAEIRPDAEGCLLVDIQLAGISGIDLQRRMADEHWTMPVIAMSGLHDPEIEADAISLGATTFLRKPFEAQMLLGAIARARASRS